MRGRKPCPVQIASADRPILEYLARSETAPWFQVRRARIVLGVAQGQRIQTLAFQLQCGLATVGRTCRRYEQDGLEGLLAWPQRPGRPIRISPPPARPNRRPGLPGAGRRRVAPYPLEQRRLGPPS